MLLKKKKKYCKQFEYVTIYKAQVNKTINFVSLTIEFLSMHWENMKIGILTWGEKGIIFQFFLYCQWPEEGMEPEHCIYLYLKIIMKMLI